METEVTGLGMGDPELELPQIAVPLLAQTQRLVSLPPVELRDAATGETPRFRTAVRVGVREGALLVRFDGRDDEVVATLRRRDEPLWTEDVFEVFVTPFDPPKLYFEFEINPLGALFDARVTSPDLVRQTMSVDVAWNLSGLRGRSRVRPGRWSALLTIPLALLVELPLPPGEGRGEGEPSRREFPRSWRANFYRVDRGVKDEFTAWSPTRRVPPDFHEARRFGRLTLPEDF